jgi:hypothetical protein
MQPGTLTYAIEMAAGLAMIVAIAGVSIAAAVGLLIAGTSCGAKPSRKEGRRSRLK